MSTAALTPYAAHAPADPARPPIANVPGRLGPPVVNRVRAVGGLPWRRRLARASLYLPRIRYYEKEFLHLADEQLRKKSMELRGKARGGWSLDKLVPEAFGLSSAAIRRLFGYQMF